MARPSSRHPTELELEILKVLWSSGPLRGRQVREALGRTRKLARTSVMTMLSIMVAKGYLGRGKEGAGYVYRPRVTRKAMTRRMLKDLVNRVFDGSAEAVMVNLLESADMDRARVEELQELLDRKLRESRK